MIRGQDTFNCYSSERIEWEEGPDGGFKKLK
jgi:hypothetical protein